MNRRDTIVVAVLINTGLLLLLFVTAINSSDEGAKLSYTQPSSSSFTEVVEVNPRATTAENPLNDQISQEKIAEEPSPSSDTYIEVVVKKGDYLEKIAKTHSVEVADIAQLNGLNSTQLQVGQLLRIPIVENTPENPTALAEENESYYVVRSGDNPWLIAMRNGIELDQLLKLNGLDEKKARRLRPGDKIRIR